MEISKYKGCFVKFNVKDAVGDIIEYDAFKNSNYKDLIGNPCLINFNECIGVVKNILLSENEAIAVFDSQYSNLDRNLKLTFGFECLEYDTDIKTNDNLEQETTRIIKKLNIKYLSLCQNNTFDVREIKKLN